ncbi:MAG: 3-dehydroquinate synthase [Flavobacteriaceae bacterium]
MNSIVTKEYSIHLDLNKYKSLNQYIESLSPSKIVILTDSNTHRFCLDYFISKLEVKCSIEFKSIPAGERFKNIETCKEVWHFFSEITLDRKALIINLGGGVVTDLGGFVASTYLRGLAYINIPTTLLSMVDASIGGKTGIDLDLLKNQIGLIINPKAVIIDTHYLKTLPPEEFNSGVAEILKHGFIHSESYWNIVSNTKIALDDSLNAIIYESILIKKEIVEKDPTEQNLRKTLNFGHTLGHALETYSHLKKGFQPLLHGEAVGIGLILACHISSSIMGFPKDKLEKLVQLYSHYFTKISLEKTQIDEILNLLKFDKKNTHGQVNFVLLKDIGSYSIKGDISKELIYNAFDFYLEL